MQEQNPFDDFTLGLDVGALAIKAAIKSAEGKITSLYRFHRGHPEHTIVEMMNEVDGEPSSIALTGAGGRRIADRLGLVYIDPAVALIAAADGEGGIRHIIDIGGGSLSIVDLDKEGMFQGFRTNSLCAAGTGSFLDEQAARMGLSIDEMSKEQGVEEPPRIAARCAVFAKSDLIHRQQEGFTIPEMWSGLCRGMVSTALGTLFRGRRPHGPVILVGGVALNSEVVRWLRDEMEAKLIIPDDPSTFSARGAIRAARKIAAPVKWERLLTESEENSEPRRQKLELCLSGYPSFECRTSYSDDDTEVRIHNGIRGDIIVGIDVGSTSTKAAVLDRDGRVLADLYRRTSGNPISATQKILSSLERAAKGSSFRIVGTGTTGSGRKMIGAILGADRVINEITAHVKGAVATDPDVETIFEIGGQDAKFISLREGAPHDSNMNYVCAAGTGSFVEEQAGKLGFALTEIGDAVMGTSPPYSTDRCTVFMEQDVHALIRKGFERREVMGSVLYSVVQNYLNRVVGRHPYSKGKICFMGATARNRGLVAAFEKLLNAPIAVSPYCHVMGAFGVARVVLNEVVEKNTPTTFVGIEIAKSSVTLKREVCELCANHCRITRAIVGEGASEETAPSWGYMCGRDPDEMSVKVNRHFEIFRKRDRLWHQSGIAGSVPEGAPTVGIPRALLAHTYLPLWRRFFGELGIRVVLSKPTGERTLPLAKDWIGSDYCYPIKLAHGHVRELAAHPDVKHIFLPYIVQGEPHEDGFRRSVFCPYNIAFPSIAKTAGLANPEGKEIVSAVINFQLGIDIIIRDIMAGLSGAFELNAADVKRAWFAALEEQRNYTRRLEEIGAEHLRFLEEGDRSGVVILGRSYNICDTGSNLNLPQKVADLDLTVFPVETLPLSNIKIDPMFNNMYWCYGRRILKAAAFIASHPRLHAVFMTNFGCGPDSFLQTYVEKIMKGKPMLMLELDEHSADAGYVTRLEAFRDVIRAEADTKTPPLCKGRMGEVGKHGLPTSPAPSLQRRGMRTLWIPPMHPYGSQFLSAAMRSVGLPAKPLPNETLETFEMAKRYCRGTECVPAPSTIGAFLNILKDSDAPERECFFMPTAKGPCRFGQYSTLHRIILDEAGYKNTPIESWDDGSGNFGLNLTASRRMYNGIIIGDILYKARCRVRPYAKDRDGFDETMEGVLRDVISVAERNGDIQKSLKDAARTLGRIERTEERKPLVGIVGEIYVRSNIFTNGSLVTTIEDAGGEAWLATTGEWFQYLTFLDKSLGRDRGEPFGARVKKRLKGAYMMRQDRVLTGCMSAVIGDRPEPSIRSTIESGERVFPRQFDGESILTVGRAIEFAENGADLIINCAPFGCMPGTLTSGIFQRLEGKMGVPVVSLFFDGETDLRHLVRTYLANLLRNNKFTNT